MHKALYMSKPELIDWLKIGCLCGEAAEIAERTPEKAWRQKLKTCVTYLEKIILERLTCLDPKQLESVMRRKEYTHIILQTEDRNRIAAATRETKEILTVDIDDLETLAELALNSCQACEQGECVADCRFRTVMHRLGIPVARDEVKSGECEFRTEIVKAGAA